MTDPRRFSDDADDEAGALFRSLREVEGPSAGARGRALTALGVGIGAGVATGSAATASAATAVKAAGVVARVLPFAKWVGVGVVSAGVVVGASDLARPPAVVPSSPSAFATAGSLPATTNTRRTRALSSPDGDAAPRPADEPAAVAPATNLSPLTSGDALTPPVGTSVPSPRPAVATRTLPAAPPVEQSPDPVPAIVETPPAAPTIAPPGSGPVASSAAKLHVADELVALDAVRGSLRAGDVAAARRGLVAYSAAFPKGQLAVEADVLTIEALVKSGDVAQARSRADAFLAARPAHPLAPRVRALVGLTRESSIP